MRSCYLGLREFHAALTCADLFFDALVDSSYPTRQNSVQKYLAISLRTSKSGLMASGKVDANCGRVDEQRPTRWGIWPTLGLSCVIGTVYVFIQVIVVAGFVVAGTIGGQDLDISQFAESLESNGLFLAATTCTAAPFTIALILLFARIRKPITVRQYLCLHRPGWKEVCKWSLVVLLFVVCHDSLTYAVHRPIVPEFMVSAYTTAYFTPLLLIAFLVLAPLSEELFFRGFLFGGIEESRLGSAGAVILTSVVWSVMHVQYDLYSMGGIFAGGLILGLSRVKTKSVYTPIIMHMLQNTIATIEVVIYLRMFANAA
jgi:membrane protease YdiL (CAAX protease family)